MDTVIVDEQDLQDLKDIEEKFDLIKKIFANLDPILSKDEACDVFNKVQKIVVGKNGY